MNEPTEEPPAFRYDEVPYESHVYAQSHIDHLASLARVFGMSPPDPRHARVLEIGCAAGGNLIPLAMAYPHAQFLGIDLSRVEIDEGRALLTPMGLSNIELRHANVTEIDESWGQFDYILCHGVWSWVPTAVQEHIFEVCNRCLSPEGVAYLSYNVYPGWRVREMVRDMMLFHTAPFTTVKHKVDQARALLDFLCESHGADATHPYAVWIRSEADLLRRQPDHYLYHDHLSDQNQPVYFYEFIQRAMNHNLLYLGDAHFGSMLAMHMPPKAREFLVQIDDLVKAEQYMDFVRQRMFRTTYLVRESAPVSRSLDWSSMVTFEYAVRGELTLDGPVTDPASKATVTRETEHMSTEEPIMKAALSVMSAAWPRSIPFEALLAEARALSESQEDEATDRESLGGLLLSCFASNMVEVWTGPAPVALRSERPEVFPWARVQIARGLSMVANLRHETVRLDPLMRSVLWLADGTRDRDALVLALDAHLIKAGIALRDSDGLEVTDSAARRETMYEAVDEALARAESQSLLFEREGA